MLCAEKYPSIAAIAKLTWNTRKGSVSTKTARKEGLPRPSLQWILCWLQSWVGAICTMCSAIGSIWTKSALSIICTICKMCYLQPWVCTIFTIRLICTVCKVYTMCRLQSGQCTIFTNSIICTVRKTCTMCMLQSEVSPDCLHQVHVEHFPRHNSAH